MVRVWSLRVGIILNAERRGSKCRECVWCYDVFVLRAVAVLVAAVTERCDLGRQTVQGVNCPFYWARSSCP